MRNLLSKFKIIIAAIGILALNSCASIMAPYSIVEDYDAFNKKGKIHQSNNYLFYIPAETQYSFGVNLYIFKDENEDIDFVSLIFSFIDDDWLFIEQDNSLQFLFTDGEVLKLSSKPKILREVFGNGNIYESGSVRLDKIILSKLINLVGKSLIITELQSAPQS